MSDVVKQTEAVPSAVEATPASSDGQSAAPSDHADETSVARISKLPVVEQSLTGASVIYGKVKDSSSIVGWTLDKAESAVHKAVDVVAPVTSCLEKPLKTVDNLLCKSLDYVESKVPAMKMPPQEVLDTTKQYLTDKVQPAVKCACAVKDCACALKEYGTKKLTNLTGQGSSAPDSDTVTTSDKDSEKPNSEEKQ